MERFQLGHFTKPHTDYQMLREPAHTGLTAILFDLDGVLVDTEDAKTDSYYVALSDRLLPYSSAFEGTDRCDFEQYRPKGVSRKEVCEKLIATFSLQQQCDSRLISLLETVEQSTSDAQTMWRALLNDHEPFGMPAAWKALAFDRLQKYTQIHDKVRKCPGARAFVEIVRRQVPILGLVTLSTRATALRLLEQIRIPSEYFYFVITSEVVATSSAKTAHYKEAMRRLHEVDDTRAFLVIEDSDAGIEAAHAAGFRLTRKVAPRHAGSGKGEINFMSIAKEFGLLKLPYQNY